MIRTSAPALAAALAFFPALAGAEPLTFDEALALANSNAPSLQARIMTVDAARSTAVAAGQLPDPVIGVSLENFPISGPPAFSLTRESMTMQRLSVEQTFPNLAKRHARASLAAAEIGVAAANVRVEARNVRLQTALAWIDLYYAEKRLEQLTLLNAGLGDLQATVAARLTAGSARPAQALEPEQLQAQVNDRRSALIADAARARFALARFTGDDAPSISGDPPELRIDRAALTVAIEYLPSLHMIDAQSRTANSQTAIARAELRPDWTVSASYGRRDPRYGDMVSLGVSFDLPLFARNRQNPVIAARTAEAGAVRLERVAAEQAAMAQLESDLTGHAMHLALLDNARGTLVPLARRRAQLDLASYGARTVDLGTALLSTLAAAEAEVDALGREAEVARDAVRITITYAGDDQ
jgi:cobalt-zinc-cadmium efflux system outer membrane protein